METSGLNLNRGTRKRQLIRYNESAAEQLLSDFFEKNLLTFSQGTFLKLYLCHLPIYTSNKLTFHST